MKYKERLQKVLADLGYGSRRKMEEWIKRGDLLINGHLAKLGDCVNRRRDQIKLRGKLISISDQEKKEELILYHKPVGQICSRDDPHHRNRVFDYLPKPKNGRWISIGRLDINTSGLLLFTNNGQLAHQLMHPKYQIEREYAVRLMGRVDDKMAKILTNGILLKDGKARFEHIVESEDQQGVNRWYRVVIMEGRNRLVRRLFESQGLSVNRLIRLRFGSIILPPELRPGKWMNISPTTIHQIMSLELNRKMRYKAKMKEKEERTISVRDSFK